MSEGDQWKSICLPSHKKERVKSTKANISIFYFKNWPLLERDKLKMKTYSVVLSCLL